MPRYIDADAMIRKICGMKCGCERYECGYDEAGCPKVRDLETAPTVSPDEVRGVGEWKKTDAFPHRVYCSNCFKTIVPNEEFAFWCEGIMPRNYCPNCGAKMEVSEDA